MADAFGLDSDVYFGDAEKPLPNWRKDAAHETDDNNEDEPQPGVAEMLGFDPAELGGDADQFSTDWDEEQHPRESDGRFTNGTGATHEDVAESGSRLTERLKSVHASENIDKSQKQHLGQVRDFYPSHAKLHPKIASAHVFYDPKFTHEAAYTEGRTVNLGPGSIAGNGSSGSLGDTFIHELEHIHDKQNGMKLTEFTPRLRQMLRELDKEESITGLLNKHRHENLPAYIDDFFRRHPGHELTDEERQLASRAVHAKAVEIFSERHQFSIADPPLKSRSKTAEKKDAAVEAATPLAAAIQRRLDRLLKKN